MYKVSEFQSDKGLKNISIVRDDGWTIPTDPANTDYQRFKIDLTNGVTLHDANNNVMTTEQVTAFVATLP